MDGRLLSVEDVSKEFDSRGKRVLAPDSVGFDLTEGEFVTIVGPSGCGKSTLLNLIVGLFRPSAGRILFRDRPVTGITPGIGYVTQRDNLLPWRTLVENVEVRWSCGACRAASGAGVPRRWSSASASTGSRTTTPTSCPAACGSGRTSSAR